MRVIVFKKVGAKREFKAKYNSVIRIEDNIFGDGGHGFRLHFEDGDFVDIPYIDEYGCRVSYRGYHSFD